MIHFFYNLILALAHRCLVWQIPGLPDKLRQQWSLVGRFLELHRFDLQRTRQGDVEAHEKKDPPKKKGIPELGFADISISMNTFSGGTIWIHAASGEIEYAKPVIRELLSTPGIPPILVTFSSPSMPPMLTEFAGRIQLAPFPLDYRPTLEKYFSNFKPRILLVFRGELWPNLLSLARQKQVPVWGVGISFDSNETWLRTLWKRSMLSRLEQIFTLREQDSQNLAPLQSVCLGNPRVDQVLNRLSNLKWPAPFGDQQNPFLTLVIGSSWPEDEEPLLPAVDLWLSKNGVVIWAPHEVSSLNKLVQFLGDRRTILFSSLLTEPHQLLRQWRPGTLILLDQVGWLAELYTWGHLAFVGGSFKKRVHSVLEPLAAGLPTIVGPYYRNSPEAVEFVTLGAVKTVNTRAQLLTTVKEILERPDSTTRGEELISLIAKRRGSTQQIASRIIQALRQKV